jgi:hypothetical protein
MRDRFAITHTAHDPPAAPDKTARKRHRKSGSGHTPRGGRESLRTKSSARVRRGHRVVPWEWRPRIRPAQVQAKSPHRVQPPEHREEIELVPNKRVPEVGREHAARRLVDEAIATSVQPDACCSACGNQLLGCHSSPVSRSIEDIGDPDASPVVVSSIVSPVGRCQIHRPPRPNPRREMPMPRRRAARWSARG